MSGWNITFEKHHIEDFEIITDQNGEATISYRFPFYEPIVTTGVFSQNSDRRIIVEIVESTMDYVRIRTSQEGVSASLSGFMVATEKVPVSTKVNITVAERRK